MKWVILTPIFAPERHGGIEKAVLKFAQALAARGESITLVAGTHESRGSDEMYLGLRVVRMPIRGAFDSKDFETLYTLNNEVLKVVEDEQPDVLWCHDWYLGLAALRYREQNPCILVSHLHILKFLESRQRLNSWRILIDRIQRALTQLGDIIIVPSPSQADSLELHYSIEKEKTLLLPYGFDSDSPHAEWMGSRDGLFRLAYAGRFETEKNLLQLIDAVALASEKTMIELYFIGSGSQEQAMRIAVQEAQIKATFFPFQWDTDELWKLIGRCDTLILPSAYESFGLIAIEALSRNCPLLVSARAGISDYLTPDKHALLFHPDQITSIESAILEAAENRTKLRTFGQAARADLSHVLDWDVSAETLIKRGTTIERMIKRKVRNERKNDMHAFVS